MGHLKIGWYETVYTCDVCKRWQDSRRKPETEVLLRHCEGCGRTHEVCRSCCAALRLLEGGRYRFAACPDAARVALELMGDDA